MRQKLQTMRVEASRPHATSLVSCNLPSLTGSGTWPGPSQHKYLLARSWTNGIPHEQLANFYCHH